MRKVYYRSLNSEPPTISQLNQATALTKDADLISEKDTQTLADRGLISRFDGWNLITEKGVKYLAELSIIHK